MHSHDTDDDVIIESVAERVASSSEECHLRSYKYRKVSKMVKKCRVKNIKFDKHFIDLSFTLSNSPETMTTAQMEELRIECMEALGSDYASSNSSSDSESESKCQICRKKKPGLLVVTSHQLNPYTTLLQRTGIKPIFNAQGFSSQFQFGITSPIQRTHLNLATLGGSSQTLASFSETFGNRAHAFNSAMPSLSSGSSPVSTPDISTSFTLGHSPLFSADDNLTFHVSWFIFRKFKIPVYFSSL